MPRGKRTRIAPGLYQDDLGFAAIVRHHGVTREKRFPKGTGLRAMRAWQDDTRAELRQARADDRAVFTAGSLADAVRRYLEPFTGPSRRDQANLLMHWVTALGGTFALAHLTTAHVKATIQTWKAAGAKASTINHRRRALVALLDAVDPPRARLVRLVPRESAPPPPIRALPIDVAQAIIDAMPDQGRPVAGQRREAWQRSKTKARLRVMLWTGIPQATMMRIRPEDVDLERRQVRVQFRRKGRGAPESILPLLPEAVEAFRAWLRVSAWGTFSTKSMAQSFRRAIKVARQMHPEIPETWRVYDLRHTFLSYMLEVTGDPTAVSVLAQHTDWRSTQRYTLRGASLRAVSAVEKVGTLRGTAAKTAASSSPDGASGS